MKKEINSNAYDTAAKEVLSNRDLLALLLQAVVPEFKSLTLNEIKENCFIQFEKATGNLQRGLNVEDNDKSMGKIRYDLLYEFKYPNSDKTFLINIEMQRNRMGFQMLIKRALYYLSRLISRQSNMDFAEGDYKNMKPVYGVWLLPYFNKSFFVTYPLLPNMLYGKLGNNKKQNLMIIVLIGIGKKDTPEYKLGKALYILFRSNSSDTMKEKELNKLGIYFTAQEWEGVVKMHLAEEYWTNKGKREGIQEGKREGIQEGKREGFQEGIQEKGKNIALEMLKDREPLEKIQKYTKIPIRTLKELAKENKIDI